jgi:hypothetical protein
MDGTIHHPEGKSQMLKTVQISDGRQVALDDLDAMTPDQGLQLATAVADVLIRSGHIRDDVALSGPHLLQFLSEMGDWLASQRPAFVVTVTFDRDGPSETLGVFASKEAAAAGVAGWVVEAAAAKGLAVDDAQRETLTRSVLRMSGFNGQRHGRTGGSDEVALSPIRDALGWVDYDIAEVDAVSGVPADPDVVTFRGSMSLYGSRSGLRYMEVVVSEPYDHEVRLDVEAKPGQSEDDLSDAIAELSSGTVVIVARKEDGRLRCTTDDLRRP